MGGWVACGAVSTMPAIQSLTLTYDALNENETFSEGDLLTGKVTLALLKETPVESLTVKAKGDADVSWTKKSGDRTHTYSAHKRYFKLKQFLIPEDSRETVVPKGIHVYKFSLHIPPGSMPSSFKGSHGKIVYKLEVKLSRSWRMDRTVQKDIRFVSKSYPNLHSLMSRQVGSTRKEMGLFSKGHVHMDVTVDKSAYAPGETLVTVAKINNSSSSEMIPKFSVTQNVVYRANSSTKHESHVIHKAVDKGIKSQTQKTVYLDISFAFDPEITFPVVIIPPDLAPGRQPGGAEGPYPAGAAGGPSNSDFPPSAASRDPYPVSPHSGTTSRYPGAQRYAAPPVYRDNSLAYAGPPGVYSAHPAHVNGGYHNPSPQLASPYGYPFSPSSTSSVLHPPPSAPTFPPPPSAPSAPFLLPPSPFLQLPLHTTSCLSHRWRTQTFWVNRMKLLRNILSCSRLLRLTNRGQNNREYA
ncbi:Arrestin domain-containing protein 3 [Liparis tanakae]|uniref:Arrestin domain-containing protein 3 n=1 Tax=Liparis tanakae TaxID=230148 RepID=A0A4Z2HN52_9TELE|nr:Arrestin domain-containing protein 3 [Liparis tanakae]